MRPMVRWRGVVSVAFVAAALGVTGAVMAAGFPEKPVTLVVPWAPGGASDVTARAVAKYAEGPLGQPIVVVNKPGGAGVVGTLEAERARPDGYTLLSCTSTSIVTQYVGNVHNDIKKLTPIVFYTFDAATLTLRADAPWRSLSEFLEHARANPGRLRNANTPSGGTSQIALSLFEKAAGVKMVQVPYPGFAPSVAALLGGHVEATTSPVSDVIKYHQEGKLRVLAVMADKRHFLLPQVPTLKEQGLDVSYGVWWAICSPAGTPPDGIASLERAFLKGLSHPELKSFMERGGWSLQPMGAKEAAAFFEKEDHRIHALLKEMGLTTK